MQMKQKAFPGIIVPSFGSEKLQIQIKIVYMTMELFFILILNITNNNITFYHTKFLITILHYRDDTMGSEKIMTTP